MPPQDPPPDDTAPGGFSTFAELSDRENRMLAELCRGRSLAAVAEQLGIHIHTARNLIVFLRMKFEAGSIAHLVARVKAGARPRLPEPAPPPVR